MAIYFHKITVRQNNDFDITLLDIDDNREANLDRFPSHRLRTFESEEDRTVVKNNIYPSILSLKLSEDRTTAMLSDDISIKIFLS